MRAAAFTSIGLVRQLFTTFEGSRPENDNDDWQIIPAAGSLRDEYLR
jgi:hypothetical protein